MPYRICKTFEIESGHQLSLDRNDMVCDFKVIKELTRGFLESWDHALCVNTADANYGVLKNAYGGRVIDFENTDPTTEAMVKRLYDFFQNALADYCSAPRENFAAQSGLRVVKVRLWETSSSWAEYWE